MRGALEIFAATILTTSSAVSHIELRSRLLDTAEEIG
jgi:hypothetical protein